MPKPIKRGGGKVSSPRTRRPRKSPVTAEKVVPPQASAPPPVAAPPAPAPERTLSALYQTAFQSCMKLWPFFLIQSLVALLNLAMMGVVLLISCWPLIQAMAQCFGEIFQNPESYDPEEFSNKLFSMATSDTSWVGIFLGLLLIYCVWALLLESLSNAGIYGGFWRNKREGKGFILADFFKDALGLFLPFMGTQLALFVMYLTMILGFRLIGMGGGLLIHALHLNAGISLALVVCLGIPLFLLYIGVAMGLMVYSLAVKAWVGGGKGIGHSLALGWKTCRAKGWFFTKGIVLAVVALMAFFLALQLFLVLTLLVPLIGFLSLFGIMLSTAFFLVFMALFMPALSVALLDEREPQA